MRQSALAGLNGHKMFNAIVYIYILLKHSSEKWQSEQLHKESWQAKLLFVLLSKPARRPIDISQQMFVERQSNLATLIA